MKICTLIKQHQRALIYLELIKQAENRILDFQHRIMIEENKEYHKQYVNISKRWLEKTLIETYKIKDFLIKRYRLLFEQIKVFNYDPKA